MSKAYRHSTCCSVFFPYPSAQADAATMVTKMLLLFLACAINLARSSPVERYHERRQAPSGSNSSSFNSSSSYNASDFNCQRIMIPITLNQTSTTNYTMDNYDVNFYYDVQNFKIFRTATYNTYAIYCAPPDPASARDTIQLLNHGATFKKEMWDFPYQPETYSWVRAMHAAGYPTLAWDAIGTVSPRAISSYFGSSSGRLR